MKFWIVALGWLANLGQPPTFESIKEGYQSSEAVLLDRHGSRLHTIRVNPRVRQWEWTEATEVAPAFFAELLKQEDQRFNTHHGIDPIAMVHALYDKARGRRLRGASTITMQLAGNLSPSLARRSRQRSWWQKLRQVRLAHQLEHRWTKDQILEAYLNLTPFRGELRGLGAASRGLFQKAPHALNQLQARALVRLIRSPNQPLAPLRRNICQGPCNGRLTLGDHYQIPRHQSWAPHVARQLLSSRHRVRSTLALPVQRAATFAVENQLEKLKDANARDASVLVVENQTGHILAYVGSPRKGSSRPHVDGVLSRRQAGSTLKPFLYGVAFEQGWLTPQTRIWDSPLEIPIGSGVYRPLNHDRRFRGGVTARSALASSLNVPAVRVLQMVGLRPFHQQLKSLGLTQLEEADHYGPSLALGSAEVSLWELVNAYRTLATGGQFSPLSLEPNQGTPTKRVYPEEVAYLISEILSDRQARQMTFGLENVLSTKFWTAVKTGTSKDMRDNWCVGFSEKYTVGVWVGNFPGEPMWNVVGTDGAAPIWRTLMNHLHRRTSSNPPPRPPQVVTASEGSRLRTTAPGTPLPAPQKSPRIRYPSQGVRFALDPDIPLENQRIPFEREGTEKGWKWVLNGSVLASDEEVYLWEPKAGSHRLALRSPSGRRMGEVFFEVVGFPP